MELSFRRWGEPHPSEGNTTGSKPKILFLHGMGGTGGLWRPIAAHLEDRFDILALDQRGHGSSRISEVAGGRIRASYTPTDYGQDVLDTMKSLRFYPSNVIGHSMGARTACAVAHLKPEWVRSLVLIDIGFDGITGGGLGEELSRFIQILPDRFSDRAKAREFMTQNCPDGSIAQYLLAVATALPPEQGGGIVFPFDHSALIRTVEQARNTSIRHWVENAAARHIPVLALRGSQSKVWSKKDFLSEVEHFSDSKWKDYVYFREIEGAGHGLPFEKRSVFLHEITQFIQEKSSPAYPTSVGPEGS